MQEQGLILSVHDSEDKNQKKGDKHEREHYEKKRTAGTESH